MSYSFSVTADTKEDAKRQVVAQFAQIVCAQSSHAADMLAACAAASAFIDMTAVPPEGKVLVVAMYGSLGWGFETPNGFTSAQMNVTII